MLSLIRSKSAILKTALLIGALVATSLTFFLTQMEKTYASSQDKKICVTATLISDPTISYRHGACSDRDVSKPTPIPSSDSTVNPTASPTPSTSVTPAPSAEPTTETSIAPDPVVTSPSASPSPTLTAPAVDPEPVVTPTPTNEPTTVATYSPTPAPTMVAPSPSSTPSSSPQPTATPSPSPTALPIPDIPAENKDPKTKSFRFCHNGSPLSNSYTGMMNGHHGNHPEDIIPPIPFKFYGGWNWNATNAKTFYNNCVPVK